MRLVILDGFTANPGDIGWEMLEQLTTTEGEKIEIPIYERTTPSETLYLARGADMLLTNKGIINDDTMSQLPEL
jgi:glycerate dehydrogenase